MTIHALAGKPAPKELLVDIDKLGKEYYTGKPDITNSAERVSFGTSGHRVPVRKTSTSFTRKAFAAASTRGAFRKKPKR